MTSSIKHLPIFLSLLLILIFSDAKAQIRTGAKISQGFGMIKSRSLDKYFDHLNVPGQGNGVYDASSRLRTHFSIAGFLEYKLSENFYVQTEPSFVYSNNKILINYTRDNVDGSGNGATERISSDAKIKMNYISLPLLGKFRFLHRKEISVFAGLNFNVYFTPKIFSAEESVYTEYADGIVLANTVNIANSVAKAEGFRTIGAQFTIGISKVFNPYGRNYIVDIRYSHPLTKSPFYTSGAGLEGAYHNSIFSKDTQEQVTTALPQFQFNDFKVGVFSFSIFYTIYKNYR